MQQYREIKARHPGTLLFFRMGDFYEMFEDDARLAARELGLTLTARNNGGAADVPLAGVPVKAATEYLRRLIALGHRVAICEQVEDPKLAKGLVRREVIETVTPGTVLAEEWLERKRNNFLVAVDPRGGAAGLAALDLTMGELVLETVAPEELPTALARYEAPEGVLPLDEMTRRNLELVEPLRPGAAVGGTTLLEVLDRTMTPMGARLLRGWLLAPLVDPAAINARLDAVDVLVADGRGRDRVREALDGVRELDELKDARDGGKRYIAGLQARERERSGIASLKVGFNKVFGYYIEVTNPHKARVPAEYERRQTLSGAERYVTPELKEYEAKVLGAEERIAAREAELVDALRRRVTDAIARVQTSARLLARLDVWSALADLAHHDGYVRPEVNEGFTIALEGSRHPVVERMMAREAFIPNDVLLDEAGRVMLLTGPNMAGKSTLLRQGGLCRGVGPKGGVVAPPRALAGGVDRLVTRRGASDNLVRGQSTFMVEMSETSAILHGAPARSLVLLDEIGRGPSAYDGRA